MTGPAAPTASQRIADKIAALGGWRGETLACMQALIRHADPDVVEEWKWDGPVWSHDGILCTGETYKDKVKLTIAKGASPDLSGLFNASLDGNARRAIDIREAQTVKPTAFKALIRAAVAFNGAAKPKPAAKKPVRKAARKAAQADIPHIRFRVWPRLSHASRLTRGVRQPD